MVAGMSSIETSLRGKKAVVTGGGRGIGAKVVRALADQGVSVVASARSVSEIEELADEIRNQGGEAWAVPCDVTNPEQVARLAESARKHLGQVDILVNNAGIAASAPLKRIQLEDWNRIFAVNVTGTFLCTQALLPAMVERRWGRVINIASIAGLAGAAYISAYSASKHAVVGFTRCLAAEVAPSGVTVNAVCPGYVETDMVTQSVARIIEKTGISEEKARGSIVKMNPQDRILDPEEVAYQVVCLCDPRARGVNGQTIVIDGGGLLS